LAEAAAIAVQGEGKWPGQARRIRELIRDIAEAKAAQDHEGTEQAHRRLRQILGEFTSAASSLTTAFDRDVHLVPP
jgi:hypothetical protein